MSSFINDDFMLSCKTASELFHGSAADMPIIDYHCHLDPRQIAENIQFKDITQLWIIEQKVIIVAKNSKKAGIGRRKTIDSRKNPAMAV